MHPAQAKRPSAAIVHEKTDEAERNAQCDAQERQAEAAGGEGMLGRDQQLLDRYYRSYRQPPGPNPIHNDRDIMA